MIHGIRTHNAFLHFWGFLSLHDTFRARLRLSKRGIWCDYTRTTVWVSFIAQSNSKVLMLRQARAWVLTWSVLTFDKIKRCCNANNMLDQIQTIYSGSSVVQLCYFIVMSSKTSFDRVQLLCDTVPEAEVILWALLTRQHVIECHPFECFSYVAILPLYE